MIHPLTEINQKMKDNVDHLESLAPYDRTSQKYLPKVRLIQESIENLLKEILEEWER